MKVSTLSTALPNIPWENRPAGNSEVVWRYSCNPIIARDQIPSSNSIFNSAVVPFDGKFAGVFRCDDKARNMNVHRGFSQDGINWKLDDAVIEWIYADPECGFSNYKYGPARMLDRGPLLTSCGATVFTDQPSGLVIQPISKSSISLRMPCCHSTANGVPFPRKINDKYVMLSRPSDNGHTPFGDIYLSMSPDMVHWGEHRYVMGTKGGWQATKVGAGPVPIETPEGWLFVLPRGVDLVQWFCLFFWGSPAGISTSPGKSFIGVRLTCFPPRHITNALGMCPT